MAIAHSTLKVDLDQVSRRLTITIRTGTQHPGEFVIKSAIIVLRGNDPAPWHEFPDYATDPAELGHLFTLAFDLPPLPNEDFVVGAWLHSDGRSEGGTNKAFRWHRGELVSAPTLSSLEEAVLDSDLAAGRIDQPTHRRRWLEMHRVRRSAPPGSGPASPAEP